MTSVARHDSGDYSDASPQEIEHDHSRNDGAQQSDYESAGSDSDRSEGDPDESQETERRVDDDEDRSNPQYIPKRGTFYEHDDRTAANGEESPNTTSETASDKKERGETPSERRRPPRKSETNKWSHDKYNEKEQTPKSREELVAIYGYDIRNEDAPPHARRNRRYGRGPNKYTRTWEDEEAYKRQAAAQQQARKPPTAEDFPELDGRRNINKRGPRPRSKSQPSYNDSVDTSNSSLRRNASVKKPSPRQNAGRERERERPPVKRDREIKKDTKEKLPPIENLTITASLLNINNGQAQPQQQIQRKVNATVAQQRPVPTQQPARPAPAHAQPPSVPVPTPLPPAPQSAPPSEPRPSKRYSSLRQRPLDTVSAANVPPRLQQYANEYPLPPAAAHPPAPHPQQLLQQMHRNANQQQQHGPSPPHQQIQQQQQQQLQQQQLQQQQIQQQQQQIQQQQMAQQQMPQQQIQQQIQQQQMQQPIPQQIQQQQLPQQQVRLGMLEQGGLVPHGHHSMHPLPQPHAMGIIRAVDPSNIQVPPSRKMLESAITGQLQSAQAYAPPAMMPAQYMQPAGAGTFPAGPLYAQPPAPYPHPHPNIYNPHHNHNYAGGVTYYAGLPVEAETPRAQRRPTAAIPIVRPAAPERPANPSEKDNIDRIVENMFVRKPWPGPGSADGPKDKDPRSSQEPASKESSQPDSLTSSSISIDSKPSENLDKELAESKLDKVDTKSDVHVDNKVQEIADVPLSDQKETQEEETSLDA